MVIPYPNLILKTYIPITSLPHPTKLILNNTELLLLLLSQLQIP